MDNDKWREQAEDLISEHCVREHMTELETQELIFRVTRKEVHGDNLLATLTDWNLTCILSDIAGSQYVTLKGDLTGLPLEKT